MQIESNQKNEDLTEIEQKYFGAAVPVLSILGIVAGNATFFGRKSALIHQFIKLSMCVTSSELIF